MLDKEFHKAHSELANTIAGLNTALRTTSQATGGVVASEGKCETFVKQKDATYSVVINIPIDRLNIDTVHNIEACLDKELCSEGFTRQSSAKGDVIVFNYWEFAVPLDSHFEGQEE